MYKNLSFKGPGSLVAWRACFRYASAVEAATIAREHVQASRSGRRRQPRTEMPEVGLAGFFPIAGLTWYATALAIATLGLMGAIQIGGLIESFPNGMLRSPLGLAFILIGLVIVAGGIAALLTTLRATANCALSRVPKTDIDRFARIIAMHDSEAAPPKDTSTYLELAEYGAAFRRMFAAREVARLQADAQIARLR